MLPHKYFPQTTDLHSQGAQRESLEREKKDAILALQYQQHGKIQKMWLFLETTQRKFKGQNINPTKKLWGQNVTRLQQCAKNSHRGLQNDP